MGRDIGIAMYLHSTRPPYERMETSALPHECNEGAIGRLEEASITAIVAMHDTRYIIFCVPIFDRCHI